MIKDTLRALLDIYGPTGHESGVSGAIADMIRPYVDEMRIDALGNLIAVKKGAGKRIMLAAHMDHIGFVVLDADEFGYLRVTNMGGIKNRVSFGRHVVFENGVHGVVHYEETEFQPTDTTLDKAFIDIGAATRDEALAKVGLGDVAVYAPDAFVMGDRMSAPAMDDRAGCAVLVEALGGLQGCPNEVVAVFTTQEEVGLRGARAAAYDVDPDIGIALDVTLCGQPKGVRIAVELGKGPAVKIMDRSLICDPKVVAAMEAAANDAGVAYQREVLTAGGTDSGAIQVTRGGVPCGVLSIPCRYVHSACETIDMRDMEGGVKLLTRYLMTAQ